MALLKTVVHLVSPRHPAVRLLLPCLIAAFLLAVGCESGKGQKQSEQGTDTPVTGGTAVVAIPADPGALNPLIYNSALAGMIFAEMHDGLAEMDDDLTYQPRIARSWDIAPDRLSITYHLRPWVWSDGEALTAKDVALSFALFKDPQVASPRRGFYRDVLACRALDSTTVRYDLARPLADPVQRTWHHILPAHVVADLDPAGVGSWACNEHPLSSGPFVMVSHEYNSQFILERNPRYPGEAPLLDRVVLRIIPERSARLMALEAQEVDLVYQIPPTEAERITASGSARVVSTSGRRFYYLQWNIRRPAFRDAATRRALSLALDRPAMVATLLGGYGRPAASPIPPAVWNHHPDLPADPCRPDLARRELAGAGWADEDGDGVLERNGVPLAFEILTRQGDPVRENGAVMLQQALARVGAKVTIRTLELATGLALLGEGRFDAYFGLLNANLYGDPSGYVHSGAVAEFNKGHYANSQVDSLLAAGLGVADRDRALPIWWKLQEILAEDPPAAYLFYPDNIVAVSPRLQDVQPHLLSPLNNMDHWWILPGDRRYRSGP